jgi:hypothetical protein
MYDLKANSGRLLLIRRPTEHALAVKQLQVRRTQPKL